MPGSQGLWWGEQSLQFPLAHALYTHLHTFLAHPMPSTQSQCLMLPTHKIPSASSLFFWTDLHLP